MANRVVFVDLGDSHGPMGQDDTGAAVVGDVLVNDLGVKYMLSGSPQGILFHYATLAAAIADTANLANGQYVLIAGGNDGLGGSKPNDDQGVWRVATAQGAARANYTKVLDSANKASEIYVDDVGNFYAATDAEAALQEIGTKQVFFKLGGASLSASVVGSTSIAFNALIAALVIDSGSLTDAIGAGNTTAPGIILNPTFAYQIPLRDAANRDVISDGFNNEVYARLDLSSTNYRLSFFSWKAGVETAYTFATSTTVDIGYILVSQDFMRLPAYAGVVQGEFFGDQAGAVGSISDTQITTTGPFTGLLTGLIVQSAVNVRVDQLGLTTVGNGASLVSTSAIAGMAATNVQAAIAELYLNTTNRVKNFATLALAYAAAPHTVGTYVIVGGLGSTPSEQAIYRVSSGTGSAIGQVTKVIDIPHTAVEVLIANASSKFIGTEVEAALNELIGAVGGATTALRDYSSNIYVTDNDTLVVAIGKLDAAISALLTDRLSSKSFSANEAIAAAANGPRLVSQDGTAFKVNLTVAGSVGPKVDVIGFATGADYVTNAAINSGDGIVMAGICTGFTGLTPGAAYYANPSAPGSITASVPTVVGQWIVPVGIAVSSTILAVRVGEPNEIVPALPALQRAIHYRSTASTALTGVGETAYTVAVGDLWIDNDTSVVNPTKSQTGRYTVYVCKVAWTGSGASITSAQIRSNFVSIGVQG